MNNFIHAEVVTCAEPETKLAKLAHYETRAHAVSIKRTQTVVANIPAMAVGKKAEFIVRPAEPRDADEIARMYNSAFLDNALWGLMMANVDTEVLQEFTANAFRTRSQLPHFRYFVAIDTSNQYVYAQQCGCQDKTSL